MKMIKDSGICKGKVTFVDIDVIIASIKSNKLINFEAFKQFIL